MPLSVEKHTVFTRISAMRLFISFVPQVRRLFESSACLKIGCKQEIFSLSQWYIKSVRKFKSN